MRGSARVVKWKRWIEARGASASQPRNGDAGSRHGAACTPGASVGRHEVPGTRLSRLPGVGGWKVRPFRDVVWGRVDGGRGVAAVGPDKSSADNGGCWVQAQIASAPGVPGMQTT